MGGLVYGLVFFSFLATGVWSLVRLRGPLDLLRLLFRERLRLRPRELLLEELPSLMTAFSAAMSRSSFVFRRFERCHPESLSDICNPL